jgi:hypothetical protein
MSSWFSHLFDLSSGLPVPYLTYTIRAPLLQPCLSSTVDQD